MDNDQSYNGWTNYETWLVALWIDNDQRYHETARTIANVPDYEYEYQRADALKEFVEEIVQSEYSNFGQAGIATDLINSALSRADFRMIVKEYKTEENQ